jgi:flagellar biosynthesis component FlhA
MTGEFTSSHTTQVRVSMLFKILLVSVVLIAMITLILRFSKRSQRIHDTINEFTAARGAVRCMMAREAFEQLSDSGNNATIIPLWNALEMPLLQALPDCPPQIKEPLANALSECAKRVTNRDVAKRMMTMRNSLIG